MVLTKKKKKQLKNLLKLQNKLKLDSHNSLVDCNVWL